jgi:hypothetical protein
VEKELAPATRCVSTAKVFSFANPLFSQQDSVIFLHFDGEDLSLIAFRGKK